MSKEFDVVVIGAGPGGYIAAIRAAQLGKSVACIEKWKNPAGTLKLGGTCLNVGCIPSKALLASSEEFENVSHHLGDHGISVGDVKLDITRMLARKEGIVEKMTKGIEFLFRKNKITWLKGHGKFTGKTDAGVQIEVSGEGETETVTAKNVIIATGSKARHLPTIPVDNKIVSDNEGALSFDTVPKKLAVIGAGVIGLELGSVWRRLGSDVTVLEALRRMGRDRNMIFKTRVDATYGLMNLMETARVEIGRVRAPTLYAYGRHDNLIPKSAAFPAAAMLGPNGRTAYYPDGWHLLNRDLHAAAVLEDVASFIRDPAAPLPSGAPPMPRPKR